ncbi:hypothetical protein KIPB_007537 [Kipferlia bialata]|uniref:THIF-type NAD/FAD binding fold domain-containing protein n=1 Tax=Kipferlia bialata TaxID=797122 RepID=A0A9K3D0E9_9EUKA|nr:hypothetical protein KIPB_007537 [Kipferlia bialata]|eukprot:g7537.t1
MSDITEHEKALYDRQLRVWGHAAQQRLKQSTVLLLHPSGVSLEIAKNLVLAGIGELRIAGMHRVCNNDDLQDSVFVTRKDVAEQAGYIPTLTREMAKEMAK